MKIGRAAFLAALFIAGFAHADVPGDEPWRPIAQQCASEIGEQGGFWPEWARCTIERAWPQRFSPAAVEHCINYVEAERKRVKACNNCGDPVADVIWCVVGQ